MKLFGWAGMVLCAALLGGCGGAMSPQVLIEPQSSELRVRIGASRVMLRDISLPAYAEGTEIAVRDGTGTLMEKSGEVWADEPARAMAGALIRNLSTITGAQVAAEPWPLEGYPDVEVTIRVEHMYADSAGAITLGGYFAVRRDYGRSAIHQFWITRPATPADPKPLSKLYESAWTELAEQIARKI